MSKHVLTLETMSAVLVSPGFAFCYGKGSFKYNLQKARRLLVPYHVVHAPSITFDLDTWRDWQTYRDLLQSGQQDALPHMPKNEERRSANAYLLVHEAL